MFMFNIQSKIQNTKHSLQHWILELIYLTKNCDITFFIISNINADFPPFPTYICLFLYFLLFFCVFCWQSQIKYICYT